MALKVVKAIDLAADATLNPLSSELATPAGCTGIWAYMVCSSSAGTIAASLSLRGKAIGPDTLHNWTGSTTALTTDGNASLVLSNGVYGAAPGGFTQEKRTQGPIPEIVVVSVYDASLVAKDIEVWLQYLGI